MRERFLTKSIITVLCMMITTPSYSQSANMQLPPQVGVYAPNARYQQQMQLPPQVGTYNSQQPRMVPTYAPQQSVYAPTPTMNEELYASANGFKTPNRYFFPKGSNRPYIPSNTIPEEDRDTNFYMALSYGSATFDGSGMTGRTLTDYPISNVDQSLGDGRNLTLGLGAISNKDFRVEINYQTLSGLGYPQITTAKNQLCFDSFVKGEFFYDCSSDIELKSGGDISVDAFNINVYLPLTELFGTFMDDFIVPYIGGGVGVSFNKIDDYTTFIANGDAVAPTDNTGEPVVDNEYTNGYSNFNISQSHFGATTNNFAWNVEAGLTFAISKKTLIDVYYKMNNLGKIKSKGEIFSSYESVDILDPTVDTNGALVENTGADGTTSFCSVAAIDNGYLYNADTNWCESEPITIEEIVANTGESGTIETTEFGVKLRLVF